MPRKAQPKNNDPIVQVPVKMPRSLRNAAKLKTKETGVSLSFIVRRALEQWTGEQAKN